MSPSGQARVVIVGNGAAAISALESFRRFDQKSRVTIVSSEPCLAYSRVLLPYYLRGKVPFGHLFIRDEAFYRGYDADLVLGARVDAVDVCSMRLEIAGGRSLSFDRLLLAPGSSPVRPPIDGLEGPEVHHLWYLDEFRRLDSLFHEGARALVLGSGFVALQGAWAAVCRGLSVTVYELADRILPQVLDQAGARILQEQIFCHGVELRTGIQTEGISRVGRGGLRVYARGLDPLTVDLVIVGTGVRPNDHLLPHAVEPGTRGILVNERMETVVDGVYAAGDVVRGPVFDEGPPQIHALWPTAVEHGRVAGENLAGARTVYEGSLNMSVTEMFGLTVASLGCVVAGEQDEVLVREDLRVARYLKVVLRGGVPVGAITLGGPGGAVVLGRLRPYVRGRRPVPDLEALFSGEPAIGPIVCDRSRGAAGPAEATTREKVECAS